MTIPATPPSNGVPSRLPAPSVGDLLRLMVPVAGVAIGAFLAFGPYLRTTRLMKGVLLTAPTLISLVAFRALTQVEKPVAPVADLFPPLELKSTQNISLPQRLDYYQKYMQKELADYATSRGTMTFSKQFTRDLYRDCRITWFQEETSGTDPKSSWQLEVDRKNQITAVDSMVTLLQRKLGFSLENIQRLSWVWHQAPFGDIGDELIKDYGPKGGIPRGQDIRCSFREQPCQHIYKILYSGAELTAMETQSTYIVAPSEDPNNEQGKAVYVLAHMRFDFKTGDAQISYTTVRTIDELAFDRP